MREYTDNPDLTCRDAESLIIRQTYETLSPATRRRLEQHQETCDVCTAYAETIGRMREAATIHTMCSLPSSGADLQPDPVIRETLRMRLAERACSREPARKTLRDGIRELCQWHPPLYQTALGGVFVIIMLASAAGWYRSPNPTTGPVSQKTEMIDTVLHAWEKSDSLQLVKSLNEYHAHGRNITQLSDSVI